MTDSSAPEFWDKLYGRRTTPWDSGSVPAALCELLSREKPGRVLIPGCGTGHEARAFAEAGWDVLAVDFSSEAVQLARERLGEYGRLVVQGDFFALEASGDFDLIYERAFLCAFPVTRRVAWAAMIPRLLRHGGILAGFFFFGPEADPPPNPLAHGELAQLLGPGFVCIADNPVSDSIPVFTGRERWQVWRHT